MFKIINLKYKKIGEKNMRYEDVYSTEELNQKVTDYVAFGYKVENRTSTYARLVKNDKMCRIYNFR